MTELLIGHLVGDFVFQNKYTAINKSRSSFVCWVHVVMYTTIASLFILPSFTSLGQYFVFMLAVAVPHFIIDRFSLAMKWMHWFNVRNFFEALNSDFGADPNTQTVGEYAARKYDIPFTAIVYVVIDQLFHVLCLYTAAEVIL